MLEEVASKLEQMRIADRVSRRTNQVVENCQSGRWESDSQGAVGWNEVGDVGNVFKVEVTKKDTVEERGDSQKWEIMKKGKRCQSRKWEVDCEDTHADKSQISHSCVSCFRRCNNICERISSFSSVFCVSRTDILESCRSVNVLRFATGVRKGKFVCWRCVRCQSLMEISAVNRTNVTEIGAMIGTTGMRRGFRTSWRMGSESTRIWHRHWIWNKMTSHSIESRRPSCGSQIRQEEEQTNHVWSRHGSVQNRAAGKACYQHEGTDVIGTRKLECHQCIWQRASLLYGTHSVRTFVNSISHDFQYSSCFNLSMW